MKRALVAGLLFAALCFPRPAAADDMYTVAGALSVDNLDSRTSWIQTRMLDPTGLAVAPDGRLVYADAGADEVRELPAGS